MTELARTALDALRFLGGLLAAGAGAVRDALGDAAARLELEQDHEARLRALEGELPRFRLEAAGYCDLFEELLQRAELKRDRAEAAVKRARRPAVAPLPLPRESVR